ncbi:MAG: pilus assembly FimT family protein [Syntrophales bacterium]
MIMRQSKRKATKDKGFTMVELVVVCIVFSIFTVVVWSTYKYSNTTTDKLMAETDGLKVSLRFAQIRAFNDDTATWWGIYFPNSTTYKLYKNNADASVMIPVKGQTQHPLDPDFDPGPRNSHQFRGNVQMASTVPIINFDRWGRPLDGSGNLMIEDPRITLSVVTAGQTSDTRKFGVSRNTGFIYDVP